MVSTSGDLAYFSSNMEGGMGSFDLYSFELYPEARPLAVTYMKGIVFDKETKEALGANFELIDLESGAIVYSAQADDYSGEFLIPITYGKDYALNAEEEGYLFYSENFQMKEIPSNEPYIMSVPMMKIEVGSELVLRNVFFETDEYDLKTASKVELNKLILFLDQNPSVKMEIEGHTDDQGNAAHNKTLSDNRAKSVYTYLVENGIDRERLKYKGFGADQPLSSNDTEEGRANNRRTSVRIIAK
jgi:outer membrane protein OmpA-like peptidoglycan-associated protein